MPQDSYQPVSQDDAKVLLASHLFFIVNMALNERPVAVFNQLRMLADSTIDAWFNGDVDLANTFLEKLPYEENYVIPLPDILIGLAGGAVSEDVWEDFLGDLLDDEEDDTDDDEGDDEESLGE